MLVGERSRAAEVIGQVVKRGCLPARGAGLADLVVDAGPIQVINGGGVAVKVLDYVLAIVNEVYLDAIRSGSLNAPSQRIVFVSHSSARRSSDLGEPIFEIPLELRGFSAFALRGQITVVVIDITCRARADETVERLVVVRRAELRIGAVADDIITVRLAMTGPSPKNPPRQRRQPTQHLSFN